MSQADKRQEISALADQCVKCGLCLPHCPTYQLSQNENHSPRGRISLMQALVGNGIEANSKTESYLDACLSCRRCEAVCPAQVKYGELIDLTKNHLLNNKPTWLKKVFPLLEKTHRFRLVGKIYWLLNALKFPAVGRQLFSRASPLGRFAHYAPNTHWPKATQANNTAPAVYLFSGCVATAFDARTLNDTRTVLAHLGFNVIEPKQACCGALTTHNGYSEKTKVLDAINNEAFNEHSDAAIISTATGCHAQLIDNEGLASRVIDIQRFILDNRDQLKLSGKPLNIRRVAVHTPCSQKNVLKNSADTLALLGLIEDIEIIEPADNDTCCGAAGSYFLEQPEMSDQLLSKKMSHMSDLKPDVIVTSNIGCNIQLQSGVRWKNLNVEVIHPISLIRKLVV